jgi:Protein NO VEIN, C-terminal
MSLRDAWSGEEVEAAVADYLHMLTLELSGQEYNKTIHRRALQRKLSGRSEASIERKHQNISAILIGLGCPYITGYKPLANYQALLFEVVLDRLTHDRLFERAAISAAEQPAAMPLPEDFNLVIDGPPTVSRRAMQESELYAVPTAGVKRDYLDREARNHSLGFAGETLVLAYERHRLRSVGKPNLSERVEHVSVTQGDGLGFDVLSFDTDGRERFIEVKTTSFGKQTPFYTTRNEVEFSSKFPSQFHLYRLFEFRRKPRMFEMSGRLQDQVRLDPVSYLARFV